MSRSGTVRADREVLALRGSTFPISTRANSTGTIWTAVGRTQWSLARAMRWEANLKGPLGHLWSTKGLIIDCKSFHTGYLQSNIIQIYSLSVCLSIHLSISQSIYQFLLNLFIQTNQPQAGIKNAGTTTTYRHLCNLYKTILNRRRVEPQADGSNLLSSKEVLQQGVWWYVIMILDGCLVHIVDVVIAKISFTKGREAETRKLFI